MITEDGTGIADADSYVDPASGFAVAYMGNHLYADEWEAADAARREAAVMTATRTLDGYYTWNGQRMYPEVQGLAWPRNGFYIDRVSVSGLPKPIMEATLELALALLQRNRTSDTASGSQPVEKLVLGKGALELEFGNDPAARPTETSNVIPPYVARLLRRYVSSGTGGAMRPIERR